MAPRTLNLHLEGTWDNGVTVVAAVGGVWWQCGGHWVDMVYSFTVMGDRMDIDCHGRVVTWHRDR